MISAVTKLHFTRESPKAKYPVAANLLLIASVLTLQQFIHITKTLD